MSGCAHPHMLGQRRFPHQQKPNTRCVYLPQLGKEQTPVMRVLPPAHQQPEPRGWVPLEKAVYSQSFLDSFRTVKGSRA